jgi:thioredoxin reductase (NADPH)
MSPGTSPASTTVEVDLLIVGAGPVGLYGAYYAGVRGLSVAVVDSLSQVGGQVTAMYPEKEIYDIAAIPVVTGRELVRGLVQQAGQYDPVYLLGQEAQELDAEPVVEALLQRLRQRLAGTLVEPHRG